MHFCVPSVGLFDLSLLRQFLVVLLKSQDYASRRLRDRQKRAMSTQTQFSFIVCSKTFLALVNFWCFSINNKMCVLTEKGQISSSSIWTLCSFNCTYFFRPAILRNQQIITFMIPNFKAEFRVLRPFPGMLFWWFLLLFSRDLRDLVNSFNFFHQIKRIFILV